MKIVNKRQRNLLSEIQNVFINGKQVKTAKITQLIPWFPQFYGTKTTGNSQRRYRPHAWTVTFARWQRLPTEVWGLWGCGQLADDLKVGRRDISKFQNSLEWLYSRCSYNTLQTMLKPTLKSRRPTFGPSASWPQPQSPQTSVGRRCHRAKVTAHACGL